MKNKITVIVPIYNAEKTIEKCIKSLINQSYKNLEIILINDGSCDESLKICNKYARIDNRIKIINQENKGVSFSRNKGIEISAGEYISFVDSDDTLDNNYFSNLIKSSINNDADIVISNIRCIDDNNEFYPYGKINFEQNINKESLIQKLLNFEIGNAVWGKLFRKKTILNIKFKNLRINEDFIYFWESVINSNKFVLNMNSYYNYYISTCNSLTKRSFNKENMSLITHIEKVKNDIDKFFPNLKADAENYYGAYLLHNLLIYYEYINSENASELYLEEIKEMIIKAKKIKHINNYFLISEKSIDIHDLSDEIVAKIKVEK